MNNAYNPNDWQKLWPEHAEAIDNAIEALLLAINRLSLEGPGDPMVEYAVMRYAIGELEAVVAAEIEGDLKFRDFSKGDDDSGADG